MLNPPLRDILRASSKRACARAWDAMFDLMADPTDETLRKRLHDAQERAREAEDCYQRNGMG